MNVTNEQIILLVILGILGLGGLGIIFRLVKAGLRLVCIVGLVVFLFASGVLVVNTDADSWLPEISINEKYG